MDVERIKSLLKVYPDFPKKGIMFQDIFPIFQEPLLVQQLVNHIVHRIQSTQKDIPNVIVGLDARGFLLGPMIALLLGCKFVPVRKKDKLPGLCHIFEYKKEYGSDFFEIQRDSIKQGGTVVVIDDLIATGGSAFAAGELIKKSGGIVKEYIFIIELTSLAGKNQLLVNDATVYSVLKFDD